MYSRDFLPDFVISRGTRIRHTAMSYSPLNRTTAPQILRLCALCLKNGVLDAYELGDDYAAEEFVRKHKENWTYGVLGEPDDYDWKMWRFSLYKWCRRAGLSSFADNYLYEVKRFNYLYCPILMSMRFYLMGIEEWLSYPNPVGIEQFRAQTSIHWRPQGGGPLKLTKKDIIAELQDISYQSRRRPENEQEISFGILDEFCKAMYDLTSKYIREDYIVIDGKTIQNIQAGAL